MHLLGVQLLLVLSVVGWSLVTVILGWFGLRVRVFTDFCLFVGCGNLMRKLQDRAVFHVFFSFSRIWSQARFLGFMVSGPGNEKNRHGWKFEVCLGLGT